MIKPEVRDFDEIGFDDDDLFGRRSLADSLSRLHQVSGGRLTVALDAPWGSGKTTFLKQARNHWRANDLLAIYLDAFENDIHGDAFSSIAAQIVRFLQRQDRMGESEQFVKVASQVGVTFIKGLSTDLLSTMTAGVVSRETAIAAAKAAKSESPVLTDVFGKGMAASIQARIEHISEIREQIGALRGALSSAISGYEKGLIIVIDELDRCRPNFAVDMIEVVKHVYDVPNVTFLISVDFNQLKETIKAVYGTGIDADRYLEKFYDFKIPLLSQDTRGRPVIEKFAHFVFQDLQDDGEGGAYLRLVVDVAIEFGVAARMTLRTFEKFAMNFRLALLQSNKNSFRVAPGVAVVSFVKVFNGDLYLKILDGSADFNEVVSALPFSDTDYDKDDTARWIYEFLRFVLTNEQFERRSSWEDSFIDYRMKREKALSVLASRLLEPGVDLGKGL